MSGIGGITYGQSQYAHSGSKVFGNKFFKEYLYFKEEKTFLSVVFYTELLALAESFTTHLAILWERFTESLLVAHIIAQVSIKKTIINTLAITNPSVLTFGRAFREFLKTLDSVGYFIRNTVSFKEIIRILHKKYLIIKKGWKESFSTNDNGLERISGFVQKDVIRVLHKKPLVSIKHVFVFFLGIKDFVRRKIDGIPTGWAKKIRSETIWQKTDKGDTAWEKRIRKDI